MSTSKKGNNVELKFRDVLYEWGFEPRQIERARPTYKPIGKGRIVSSRNDFWGLYDFVVRSCMNTWYIQVKSTISGVSDAKQKIVEDMRYNSRKGDIYIIALYLKRVGFMLYKLSLPSDEFNLIDQDEIRVRKEKINFKGMTIEVLHDEEDDIKK